MTKRKNVNKMKTPQKKSIIKNSFEKIPKEFHELEDEKIKWYKPFIDDPKEYPEMAEDKIPGLKKTADQFLANNVINYNNDSSKDSQLSWVKTMVNKGTSSDKLASGIILIQESPANNLSILKNLINMVKVGKKQYIMVLESLTKLFLEDLLPPNRKLRLFAHQPLTLLDELSKNNAQNRRERLIYWSFEEELKQIYATFIQAVISVAHDSVEANREKAINSLFKLLLKHPEQESVLLSALANKFGDPSKKIASKAVYCLSKILNCHPAMRQVVLEEIEKIMFRTGQAPRPQYYGICFLAQYNLDENDDDDIPIASHLIRVYFSFFNAATKEGNVDTRMMSALLLGVSRAFPLVKKSTDEKSKATINKHIDTIYRLVHLAQFNITVHALSILQQVKETSSDRFYSALYKKLQDPNLLSSSRISLFLNVIYLSLKDDRNINRIKVIVKRLLQVALESQPPLACAILLLISNIFQTKPVLKTELSKGNEETINIEHENTTENITEQQIILANTEVKHEETFEIKRELYKSGYDPKQRNPALAGGQYCRLTELQLLIHHSHPTIALFAQKILKGEKIKYSGDPLNDFTLIRFLERFSFKNPKQRRGTPHQLRVTSTAYLRLNEDELPVHERFMYKFLHNEKRLQSFKLRIKKEKEGEEKSTGDVSDDELDEYLNRITGVNKDEEELESPEDLDFANAIEIRSLKNKRKRDEEENEEENNDEEEEFDDDDDDFDNNDVDPDVDFDEVEMDDEEFSDIDLDDMDAEDIEFPEEDEDEEMEDIHSSKKKNSSGLHKDTIKKALKKISSGNVFASAEEFSDLLQDDTSHYKAGSSKALSNKDRSGVRQLEWEEKRNNDNRPNRKKFKNSKFNKKKRH